jgi:hypothetical protein
MERARTRSAAGAGVRFGNNFFSGSSFDHFKGLPVITKGIKEYSQKYDFDPLPIPKILTR